MRTTLSHEESIFLTSFTSLLIIIGSLANGAVILTFLVVRELRRRPSDTLILNLAVADFVSLVTYLPLHTFIISEGRVGYGLVYFLYESLNSMGTYSSGNAIFSIAVDKFLAVVFPLRYKTLITQNVVCLFIALSWIVAVLFGIVNFLSYTVSFYFQFLVLWITYSLLLLLATTILYCAIFSYSVRQRRKILEQRRNIPNKRGLRYRLLLKITLNSFVLVCLFHGTFLPMVAYITHFSLVVKNQNGAQLTERIWIYSFLFLNACINPFIYTCSTKTFKEAFRRRIWPKIVAS